MMKKALVSFTLALTLTACGSGSSTNSTAADTDTTSQQTDAQTSSQTSHQSTDGKLTSKLAKRSYALGMDIGNSVNDLPVDLKVSAFMQGVRDVVTGSQTQLSHQEKRVALQNLSNHIKSAKAKNAKKLAQANLEAGKAFLANNKAKDGVHVTDSGLQYKILKKGDGPVPDLSDTVTVKYTGKLIDGTVFDSTHKRGEPVTFPVNAVISGWTEALQMMHEGARYKLFIPPKLAYGTRGAGPKIGPNQVLIFTVTLVKVNQNKGDVS